MTFKLTEAQFQYLFVALHRNGMTNEPSHYSTNFTTSGHGIIAQVDYDVEEQEAAVEIMHKPFIVSEDHIQTGIEEIINSMPNPLEEVSEDDKA